MRREDVEALRARMLREANNTAKHGVKLADMTFSVEGDTLEALCRAWLALEDAEIAEPAMQSGRLVSVIVRDGAHYKGQRLRLVPEAGHGGVDYWGSKPNGGEADWTGYGG